MDEAKAMAEHQQQLLLHHHQQQQQRHHHHQQQQQMLLQHLQKQQQQQQAAIDPHLRSQALLLRPTPNLPPPQSPNPNPSPNPISPPSLQNPSLQNQQQQAQHLHQQQQKGIRPNNQVELQMAYQDAWRVCHPDFKRPFTNLEDACERLLPYHVVADYEAEEDDRILDSDTTGQVPSRSQQWDHNIAVKVAEFTATFEKQALAFNIITRKRAMGEFRSEERLMVEQALLQDEKRAMLELRAQMESREKAAMAMAEQARAESQVHAQMMARASAIRSQQSAQFGYLGEQEQGININQHEMVNGWGSSARRDEKEASDYFLNDEETENGYSGMHGEWHEVGQFDLNAR